MCLLMHIIKPVTQKLIPCKSLTPVPFYFYASLQMDFFAYWFNVTKNSSLLVFTVIQACTVPCRLHFISFLSQQYEKFLLLFQFSLQGPKVQIHSCQVVNERLSLNIRFQVFWLKSLCLFQLHNTVQVNMFSDAYGTSVYGDFLIMLFFLEQCSEINYSTLPLPDGVLVSRHMYIHALSSQVPFLLCSLGYYQPHLLQDTVFSGSIVVPSANVL